MYGFQINPYCAIGNIAMSVHFHYQKKISIPACKRLKAFILNLFHLEHQIAGTIDYIFCDDDFLLDINRRTLQHDYYTDILTFDLTEEGEPKAEIYISIDRVRENARTFSSAFQDELLRVIFHGALHLCGYKDKTPSEAKAMREAENKYIRLYQSLASD